MAIEGRSSKYLRIGDAGISISFNFCPECGSTVYYTLADMPDEVAIPVGAFADQGFPEPSVSYYESRRHHWVSVPIDADRFDD